MNQYCRGTVLCAWELGGEFGHISRLSAIAKSLEKDGFNVVVALRDLSGAAAFFIDTQVKLMQAPVCLPQISMQRPVACLADAFLLSGYLNVEMLEGLVQGWESLIDLVQPDIMIFDYAPTALLAARERSITQFIIGTGFSEPAPGEAMMDWRQPPVADGLMVRQETRILTVINEVLARRGRQPLAYLHDIFQADTTFVQMCRELDLFPHRINAVYCPGIGSRAEKAQSEKTQRHRPKIVAYLKAEYPNLSAILTALSQMDADVLVTCPSSDPAQLKAQVGSNVCIAEQWLDLVAELEDADLFIGHANGNSTRECLALGVPSLMFPLRLEQLWIAQKLQKNGLGRFIQAVQPAETLAAHMNEMLVNRAAYQERLHQLMAHYPRPLLDLSEAVTQACLQRMTS